MANKALIRPADDTPQERCDIAILAEGIKA